jgi:signal peptidase I
MIHSQLTLMQWKSLINQSKEPFELEVISESMWPTLEVGDRVLVTPLTRLPRRGEVIVFYRENLQPSLVVHRCLGGLKFSGDHTLVYDHGVEEQHILGVVYQCRRAGDLLSIRQRVPFFKSVKMFSLWLKRSSRSFLKSLMKK